MASNGNGQEGGSWWEDILEGIADIGSSVIPDILEDWLGMGPDTTPGRPEDIWRTPPIAGPMGEWATTDRFGQLPGGNMGGGALGGATGSFDVGPVMNGAVTPTTWKGVPTFQCRTRIGPGTQGQYIRGTWHYHRGSAPGWRFRRCRRMNPLNVRALRRAGNRVESAARTIKRVKILRKFWGGGATPGRRSSARSRFSFCKRK